MLRPYQVEAIANVERDWSAGHQRVLVVCPTGMGKTHTFAELARRTVACGGRVLVLAHRTELLEQARAKLLEAGCDAAIEQAGRRARGADVVVASVQTLRGARLERFARVAFELIIVDEAHHVRAAGYETILSHFSSARVLGVTATPDRLDGKGLGEVFSTCAYRYELRDAIRDEWLVPIVARRIELEGVDLSEVHTRRGDLDQAELGEVMTSEAALHGVVVPLLRESSGRRTLGFAVDVAHAHALAEVANRYEPGCARALDGTMAADERRRLLAAFRVGKFRVLWNCEVLTEGFDDPGISCVALCRPTKSRALLTQMVGRGTRRADAEGKRDVLVLGIAPSTLGRHSLVCPADVLAGREVSDEVRAELDRLLDALPPGEQLALDEVLANVEDEIAARRERHKATATARYIAEEVDPFVGELPELDGATDGLYRFSPGNGEPATSGQRALLEKLGLDKVPDTLTAAEAGRIIGGLEKRKQLGLCSLKQARLLRRAGYANTERLTASEAGRLIPNVLARYSAQKSMRRAGGIA